MHLTLALIALQICKKIGEIVLPLILGGHFKEIGRAIPLD